MQVLNKKQVQQKIARLAIQILEQNYREKQLILAGINVNGQFFAEMLVNELRKVSDVKIILTNISLNPAAPLSEKIEIDLPQEKLKNQVIIIVDDVANTGRTIFYAFKPFLEVLPKKIQAAVLVDRKHKSFPVAVDYVGLSLATTLRENIEVQLREENSFGVFLN